MHTMRFADEVVDPSGFDLPRVRRKPSDQEVKMASKLVDGLHRKFDPSEYEDTYREDVLKLIELKAAGKNIELPEAEEPEPADDLLAQLEASLA
jgi:DNA end-binding protein Ku